MEAFEAARHSDPSRGQGGVMFSLRRSSGWQVLLATAASLALVVTAVYSASLVTTAARELGQPGFVSSAPNTVDANSADRPDGVAIDTSVTPNILYFADSSNNRVLAYTCPASGCTALAEGALANFVIGQPNFVSNSANQGTSRNAFSLYNINAVAVDSSGRLYVSDAGNNRVLVFDRVTANDPSAIAVFGQGGDFTAGSCNLNNANGPDADTLCNPTGIAIDKFDNVYIADYSNNRVLEYNTPLTVTSVPGSGDTTADLEFGQGSGSGNDFTDHTNNNPSLSKTSLYNPWAVTTDSNANVFIADFNNNRVLEFKETTTATTAPGNTTANLVWGQGGSFTSNTANLGQISASSLWGPTGVAVDSNNNLYISDYENSRELEFDNAVATSNTTANLVFGQDDDFTAAQCDLAGQTSTAGATAQTLCNPIGVTVDSKNDFYVADYNNNRILAYTESANPPINNIANTELGQGDFIHSGPNIVNSISFYQPENVVVDSLNHLYVSDLSNNRVLGFADASSFTSGEAATIVIGQPDFNSSCGNQCSSPSAETLYGPLGLAVDSANNLYVADYYNNRVLEYNAPFSQANKTDLAANAVFGQGGDFTTNYSNFGSDSNTPDAESLYGPDGLTIDNAGNLWVADYNNNRVLEYYTPLFNSAANFVLGQPDFLHNQANQGSTPTVSTLYNPASVRVDSHNNVYVADFNNCRVLEYNNALTLNNTAANQVWGQAGSFTSSTCNLNGPSASSLWDPNDIALDSNNNLYIADFEDSRVLEFNEASNPPTNTTADRVFGQADDLSTQGCNFYGTLPSAASECQPTGVNLDSSGNLYVADRGNNRVLQYDPPHFAPAGLTFENVPLKGKSTQTTDLVNTQGVWLNNIKISIGGDSEFKITKNSCSNSLERKSECAIEVTFTRTSTGVKKATLSAHDDATNSPQHASLTAN
jgi:sugar lactone lactonase YvrE